jgi:hypothetical protein
MRSLAERRCFRFCEFLDSLLYSPGADLPVCKLAVRWGWPESTLRGMLYQHTSPDFDRVCATFWRMSCAEQDALLGGLTQAVPQISFARNPAAGADRNCSRDVMTIAMEMQRVDQEILCLVCQPDPAMTTAAGEKLAQLQQRNQLRRRLGEEMVASLTQKPNR